MSDELLFTPRDLKGFFTKNSYVKGFSIFSIFVLLLLILNLLNLSYSSFLFQLPKVIGTNFLIFLLILSIISTVLAYFEKYKLMFLPILIWLLVFTIDIRTANIAGLKDITTNDYTLGPDLDPFLYLRHAKEIVAGNYSSWDTMRSAPLGTQSYASMSLMPWAIVFFYKILSIFSNPSVTYAAIISPVIFFTLSTIFFFFFLVSLFKKENSHSNWTIASIATAIYIVVPVMLHRTVAGIPEIESLGMVFFWAAFLFMTLSLHSIKNSTKIILGILAGISTGGMIWTWGGYRFIYMILVLSLFIAYLITKDKLPILISYASWLIPSLIIAFLKFKSISPILASITDLAPALFILVFFLFDFYLGDKIKEKSNSLKFLEKYNLPREVISLISLVLISILLLLILNSSFVFSLVSTVYNGLIHPFGTGRIGLTVAENRAPYFNEFMSSFGYIFWPFFLGTLLLFYILVKNFPTKYKFLLNLGFILALCGILFSRISSTNLLNGENFISSLFYMGGILIFIAILIYSYIKLKETDYISNLNLNVIIVLAFSFWSAVSIRAAIRIFFIVGPMILLSASFIIVYLWNFAKKSKDSTLKFGGYIISLILLLIIISSFVSYTQSVKSEVSGTVPGIYEQQWQKAMSWVRENTPANAIFTHWWDYGYWVQSIGERPTNVDGGHPISFWNHLVGRYLLTESNPLLTLTYLKSYNVSYVLIDSSDIGKYGAFASIGSDASGKDRFSYITPFVLDEKNTQETASSTIQVYAGQTPVDKDIIYNQNGTTILLPADKAFVIGIVTETTKAGELKQPKAVFYYNGNQYRMPLRYIFANGKAFDFGSGINSEIQFMPSLIRSAQGGASISPNGALLYLSEKVKDNLFTQLYLQNDPNKRYPSLTLAHLEQDVIINQVKEQLSNNLDSDFLYYSGVGIRGPIKIWKVDYPTNLEPRAEFLSKTGDYAEFDNLTITN